MKIINVTLDTVRPPTNAELKGLSEGVNGMQKNIETLQAENAALREKLEPFVQLVVDALEDETEFDTEWDTEARKALAALLGDGG